MDKHKYDSVIHLALHYCSPLNNEMVDEITDLMKLTPGKHVMDIGCAKSEILIRMTNRCQVKAFGVDPSPLFIEASHKQIADRVPAADITLYHTTPAEFTPDPAGYDATMCINSSELYGSYEHALREITRMTKPGGMVLMGDYYWRKKPDVEMSEFLVDHDYMSAIETGMKQGLTPLFVSVCTQVDLDRYIWMQNYSAERYMLEAAQDPDSAAILARVRMMRSLYVEYGRETLGFGLFLFRNPLE